MLGSARFGGSRRLSCRLPARLSRWRSLLPDQTGVGAVPLWRANACWDLKRSMPADFADELRSCERSDTMDLA